MFVRRGDIWIANFNPTEGHEQAGTRPAVVLTSNQVDVSETELVFVVPGTRTARTDPTTNEILPDVVRVEPSRTNGLTAVTYFLCDQLRAVSTKRLGTKKIGRLTDEQLYQIEDILICLLDLGEKNI